MGYKLPSEQRKYQREWVRRRRADFFRGKKCKQCGETEMLGLKAKVGLVPKGIYSASKASQRSLMKGLIILCHICSRNNRLGYN